MKKMSMLSILVLLVLNMLVLNSCTKPEVYKIPEYNPFEVRTAEQQSLLDDEKNKLNNFMDNIMENIIYPIELHYHYINGIYIPENENMYKEIYKNAVDEVSSTIMNAWNKDETPVIEWYTRGNRREVSRFLETSIWINSIDSDDINKQYNYYIKKEDFMYKVEIGNDDILNIYISLMMEKYVNSNENLKKVYKTDRYESIYDTYNIALYVIDVPQGHIIYNMPRLRYYDGYINLYSDLGDVYYGDHHIKHVYDFHSHPEIFLESRVSEMFDYPTYDEYYEWLWDSDLPF